MFRALLQWIADLITHVTKLLADWVIRETSSIAEQAVQEVAEKWRRAWSDFKRSITPRRPSWARGATEEERADKARTRLREALSDERRGRELTFASLYQTVRPPSPFWLALATTEQLKGKTAYHRVFRVRSPRSSFYRDFSALEAVPSSLLDARTREEFAVTPDLVTVVLKPK